MRPNLGNHSKVLVLAVIGNVHVLRLRGQDIGLPLLNQLQAVDAIPSRDALHPDAGLRGIGQQLLALFQVDLRNTQAIWKRLRRLKIKYIIFIFKNKYLKIYPKITKKNLQIGSSAWTGWQGARNSPTRATTRISLRGLISDADEAQLGTVENREPAGDLYSRRSVIALIRLLFFIFFNQEKNK